MKDIMTWQREAHALAVSKAFYEGKDKRDPVFIGSRLALIHREISEATECVCQGRMELGYVDPGRDNFLPDKVLRGFWQEDYEHRISKMKPEGFPIELADVFLRLCDFAESQGIQLDPPELDNDEPSLAETPDELCAHLNGLHYQLALAQWNGQDADRLDGFVLSNLLADLLALARGQNIDLYAMAELKHAYNRTRPYKHGKKL